MKFLQLLFGSNIVAVISVISVSLVLPPFNFAQPFGVQTDLRAIAQSCPLPLLDRLASHRIAPGETLAEIAKRYKISPETIMGLNFNARSASLPIGETLLIPPFNGIRVNVPPGMIIRDVAKQYKVRADVLFELNGCQPAPSVLFIPGITWSVRYDTKAIAPSSVLKFTFPLQSSAPILTKFGFRPDDTRLESHSGVDLAAPLKSPVFAVAEGTIAFAGSQGPSGNLIVINHPKGFQTRYAHLGSVTVKQGQRVTAGETIGTVGQTGVPSAKEPHLHFEVRSNTKLGWVAEDPLPWLGLK